MEDIPARDRELLIRDKYAGDRTADLTADRARLVAGEPLAYVIGWVPFLGLSIGLRSKPLIPRAETEWWTELLLAHLAERYEETPFSLLDLCAGSGAIGLAVLARFPKARVTFVEREPAHTETIRENLSKNGLDASRASIHAHDLFAAFTGERFDIIATNPPYVPEGRVLDASVTQHEPPEALYAGPDGLALIRRIAAGAPQHLAPQGELWMECDQDNAESARTLLLQGGAHEARMHTDLYGRPRIVVGYYP